MIASAVDGEDSRRRDPGAVRTVLIGSSAAVLCVAVAGLLRWMLQPYLGDRYTLTFFLLAVVAAAFIGGTRPALMATVVSWGVALWLFIAPRYSLWPLPMDEIIGSIVFWLTGVAIALIAGRMSFLQRRAQRTADERTREVRNLAEKLKLSDRFSLIGTLTAGVAHDIGNMLLPMRARLASLDAELRNAGVSTEDVARLRASAEYLASLARSLSQFVVDPTSSCGGTTRLGAWCEGVCSLLQAAVPRTIRLECAVPEDLPEVAIAPHALSQVVFNAVQNAGKAMADRGWGRIDLIAEADVESNVVRILVRDDGPGMSAETLQRLRETKPEAHRERGAVGLGFPLMRSIMASTGGTVTIVSEEGRGTEVRLDIPAATTSAPVR